MFMKTRVLGIAIVALLVAAGYASWRYYTHSAGTLDNAMVSVNIWEKDTGCTVSSRGRAPGHKMPCADVGRYLNGQLRLASGDRVLIVAMGEVSPPAIDAVSAEVKRSGYKVAGVFRLGPRTEPDGSR